MEALRYAVADARTEAGEAKDAREAAESEHHELVVYLQGLGTRAEQWDSVLAAQCTSEDAACSPSELVDTLQDKMGEVVLGMPAGSAVQSVIAEYLNELLGRARAAAAAE